MNLSTTKPFILQSETVRGYGEDSAFVHNYESGLVVTGVFDGCGEIGSRKYSGANDRTGAYIGSRIAACAASEFFEQEYSKKGVSYIKRTSAEQLECVRQLKEHITGKLSEVKEKLSKSEMESGISLPTAVSITATMSAGKFTLCNCVWAGNSRSYMIDDQGLCQLTVDDTDVDSGDAFLDMRKKSRITNFAGGNVSFLLRSGFTVLARPSILVNASADCFSHFRTPMDFENVVLETMAEAQSPSRWMARLGEKMKKVSGGDFTMTIACYGFEDFDDMKKYYSMRLIRLQNDYINMQAGADGKILKQLWDKYKSVYYRNPLKREY